jgi:4-hydroxybenzoyl-CoA thioesterase
MRVYSFRVAWFDCDPAGIVFYPRFMAYMNEAAHGYLEACGYPIWDLNARGVAGAPMVSVKVDFRAPMRLGDHGRIETSIPQMGRSSINFLHRVMKDDTLVCEAAEVRVYAHKGEGGGIRAAEIPAEMREALLRE